MDYKSKEINFSIEDILDFGEFLLSMERTQRVIEEEFDGKKDIIELINTVTEKDLKDWFLKKTTQGKVELFDDIESDDQSHIDKSLGYENKKKHLEGLKEFLKLTFGENIPYLGKKDLELPEEEIEDIFLIINILRK